MKKRTKSPKPFKRWALHSELHGFYMDQRSWINVEHLFRSRYAARAMRLNRGLYAYKVVRVAIRVTE